MTRVRRDPAAAATDGERLRLSGGLAGLVSAALGIAGGSMEVLLPGPWPTASDAGYAGRWQGSRARQGCWGLG